MPLLFGASIFPCLRKLLQPFPIPAHLVLELCAADAGEAGSWWNSTANCLAAEKTKFQSELFLEFLLRIQLHEVNLG